MLLTLHDQILDLKRQRNAVILAHNYQLGEVQDVADFVGDSLGLSQQAAKTNADVIVFGHTHVPYTKTVDGVLFVNVGSVGKPKDGDPRACYALIDFAGQTTVAFRRVEYDVQEAAAAIRRTDLPHKFARDIELGGASVAASETT